MIAKPKPEKTVRTLFDTESGKNLILLPLGTEMLWRLSDGSALKVKLVEIRCNASVSGCALEVKRDKGDE